MINGVGRNHFVTLMIFMNYTAVFWKIGISHTKVHISPGEGGGGGYCNICYIGACICHCEWYGFQAAYPRIGYINQRVWVLD